MRQKTKVSAGRIIISSAVFLSFAVLVSGCQRDSACTFETNSPLATKSEVVERCKPVIIREYD